MWFTENPWPPMVIAGLCALIFFGLWNRERRQPFLTLAVIFLLTTGGIYAFERAIVTEPERVQHEIVQLADQFRRKDRAAIDHFSESQPGLRTLCETLMAEVEIRDDLRLFDFRTTMTNQNSRATVQFRANGTISAMGHTGHHPFRCQMTFQKESGGWKIIEVQRMDPLNGEKIQIKDLR